MKACNGWLGISSQPKEGDASALLIVCLWFSISQIAMTRLPRDNDLDDAEMSLLPQAQRSSSDTGSLGSGMVRMASIEHGILGDDKASTHFAQTALNS